tara:strand:+ start:2019 stop:2273 length:255 start_codon:yes stop_codon:yes gene_type:complete
VNADDILEAASAPESSTRFQRWLEAQSNDVQELFWDVIDRGYVAEGRAFARLLRAFLEATGCEESFTTQSVKYWVDRKIEQRNS